MLLGQIFRCHQIQRLQAREVNCFDGRFSRKQLKITKQVNMQEQGATKIQLLSAASFL
jgi:hypothetical protein